MGEPDNRPRGYVVPSIKNGVIRVDCEDWVGFTNFVNHFLTNMPNSVFRGHALEAWQLKPTLSRVLDELDFSGSVEQIEYQRQRLVARHLEGFKYAARGRRGANPAQILSDDDWWAIGQHHGLATPLLDWSESPFVAAYFAFSEDKYSTEGNAIVYVLSRAFVSAKVEELDNPEEVRFIRPLTDDNARLINQRGLFTICTAEQCMKDWVGRHFSSEEERNPMIEVSIPRSQRVAALRSLNRMNINALTLFPDLGGSSEFCNKRLVDGMY